MKTLINLTPHDIKIIGKNQEVKIIAKTGIIARVKTKNIKGNLINDEFLSFKQIIEEVIDLPEPQENVIYIVSNVVLKSCWYRKDIVAPNTTIGANKSNEGSINYVNSFIRN